VTVRYLSVYLTTLRLALSITGNISSMVSDNIHKARDDGIAENKKE